MYRSNDAKVAALSSAEVHPTICVVITTFNDGDFLPAAIESVLRQEKRADEVIVVDDGSERDPSPLLAAFSQVQLIRKRNGGLSSARNAGLHASRADYIAFLDADDLLEPNALRAGLAAFQQHPHAAMAYGGHRRIDAEGNPLGKDHSYIYKGHAYEELLTTNFIGMHATVLYRREVLLALGGFDESLRLCEDYDLYLRLARVYEVAAHSEIIAEYRRHQRNISSNSHKMLEAVLAVHGKHRKQSEQSRKRAWHQGQQHWRVNYRPLWPNPASETGVIRKMFGRVARSIVRRAKNRLRGGGIHRFYRRFVKRGKPLVGSLRYGDFGGTYPIDDDFGYSRGNPIDRYYIENYLQSRSADIRGHVLEVGEDTYSKRFGGSQVTKQDVLHYCDPDPIVTILGDLTKPGILPDNTFDCIILTQTLQLIFNLDDAVTRLHAALKPGGILLLTVPGITQIERTEWSDSWYWSFTRGSIRRLFGAAFTTEGIHIEQFGNVFAATTYLQGVALEEVDHRKLDVFDEAYPIIVALRAQKT